jgi:multidrug resistance efflux pump
VNCDADCRHIRYAQSDFYKVRARLQSKIKYWSDKRRLAVSLAARTKANEKLQTAKAELDKMKGEGK